MDRKIGTLDYMRVKKPPPISVCKCTG